MGKIVHVGDIHIRLLRRHVEYRTVFNRLYDALVNIDDLGAIVVAGDIVHSKIDMSPELVDLTFEFLNNLSLIARTIVIDGNHDLNLNNKNRMSSLKPIINRLNNIYYSTDDYVFWDIGNIRFHQKHITGDISEFNPIMSSNINVMVYHGAINGSMTDFGYKINNESLDSHLFTGFDAVMLGDIHKQQCIQSYNLNKKFPEIWYCGSLIQQNYGESLDKHGFLLWDFDKIGTNKFVKSVDIENDYGFVDILVENGKISTDLTNLFPKYPNVRLKVKNTTSEVIDLIKSDIIKQYDVQEFRSLDVNEVLNSVGNEISINNIRNVDYQNELLEEYLKFKYSLDDDIINNIKDINKRVNSEIQQTDRNKDVVWIPKSLKFSNVFSYGEDNYINFESLGGIYGLFGKNASGKSSIIDILLFCLFDKCSRTHKAVDVLNTNKDIFNILFEFEFDGNIYYIERRGKRNKASVKVNVDFYYKDGESVVNLNGFDRYDTNKIIRQYVGTYDDFILTSFSLQNNNINYINLTQSDKKDILTKFLDIGLFDEISSVAKRLIRGVDSYIKMENKTPYRVFMDEIEVLLSNVARDIEKCEKQASIIQNRVDWLTNRHLELKSQLSNNILYEFDEVGKLSEIDKVEFNMDNDSKILDTKIRELGILESELFDIEQQLSEIDSEKLCGDYKLYVEFIESIEQVTIEIDNYKRELDIQVERLEHLKLHEYNSECEICVKNNKLVYDEIQKLNENIIEIETLISEYIDTKNTLEFNMEDVKDSVVEINIFDSLQNKSNEYGTRINSLKYDIALLDNMMSDNLNKKKFLQKELYLYKLDKESMERDREIQLEIDIVLEELDNKKYELIDINNKLNELNKSVGKYESKLEEYEKLLDKLNSAKEEYELYNRYLDAVSRDGIPKMIASNILPTIQSEINNILSQITDFTLKLSIDDKVLNIVINNGEYSRSLMLGSGMEKFISSLVIRMALINITSLSRPNFIAIDEGWGTLDSENISNVYLLFEYLRLNFKFVLIISHIDFMRDMVDGYIEVEKNDGISKINLEN